MTTSPNASPFWTFSLRLYAAKGVPAACLLLQERSGVDVNVLLFCLYAALQNRRLDRDDVAGVVETIDDWRADVVVPLRGVRTRLKAMRTIAPAEGVAALRERVKSVELEAERLEQEGLFARWPMSGLGSADAAIARSSQDNIHAYERALGATFDPAAVETLAAALRELKDMPA